MSGINISFFIYDNVQDLYMSATVDTAIIFLNWILEIFNFISWQMVKYCKKLQRKFSTPLF